MSASTAHWRLSPHEATLRLVADRRVEAARRETIHIRAVGRRIIDATPFLDREADAILDRLAALAGAGAGRQP